MPHINQRVEIEMKILKARELASRINDDEFVKRSEEQIAELEQKLRDMVKPPGS